MIRAGIIGFGHMHVNEIAEYIAGQPDTELVAFADVPLDLAELKPGAKYTREWNMANVQSRHPDAKKYEKYEDMLDGAKPDVVYVLCDNLSKEKVAEACARRGINIVLEKPMTVTLDSARNIAALAEKYGVEIFVNWPVTWRAYLTRLYNAVDSGIVGRLLKLSYQNGHTGPLGPGASHRGVDTAAESMTDAEKASTWWYNERYGGGAALDIGCYGACFSRWFQRGKALGVRALAMNLATPFCDCEDNIAFMVRYADAMTVAEGTWTTPNKVVPKGPVAYCEKGVLWCEAVENGVEIRGADVMGNPITVPEYDAPDAMRNMPWNYASHVLDGAPVHPTVTLAQNVDVIAILDAAKRAAWSGNEEAVR